MNGRNILRMRILMVAGIIVIMAALVFLYVYTQMLCKPESNNGIHCPEIQIYRF